MPIGCRYYAKEPRSVARAGAAAKRLVAEGKTFASLAQSKALDAAPL